MSRSASIGQRTYRAKALSVEFPIVLYDPRPTCSSHLYVDARHACVRIRHEVGAGVEDIFERKAGPHEVVDLDLLGREGGWVVWGLARVSHAAGEGGIEKGQVGSGNWGGYSKGRGDEGGQQQRGGCAVGRRRGVCASRRAALRGGPGVVAAAGRTCKTRMGGHLAKVGGRLAKGILPANKNSLTHAFRLCFRPDSRHPHVSCLRGNLSLSDAGHNDDHSELDIMLIVSVSVAAVRERVAGPASFSNQALLANRPVTSSHRAVGCLLNHMLWELPTQPPPDLALSLYFPLILCWLSPLLPPRLFLTTNSSQMYSSLSCCA